MTTYPEDMAFFEKHHLLKTFTNALMKVVKHGPKPPKILKTRGREREK